MKSLERRKDHVVFPQREGPRPRGICFDPRARCRRGYRGHADSRPDNWERVQPNHFVFDECII